MIGPELNHLKGFALGMDMVNGAGKLVGRWPGDVPTTIDILFATGTLTVRVFGPGEGFAIIDDETIPVGVSAYTPDSKIDYRRVQKLRLANGGWVVPT